MTTGSDIAPDIRWAMTAVPPGGGIRTVCPFCNADHEKSFSVRRMTDKPFLLRFNCYRGTCDQHGYVVDRDGSSMVLQATEPAGCAKSLAVHDHCTPEFLEDLACRYKISQAYLRAQGVRFGAGSALCMPWRDSTGNQVGWVEKRFDKAWDKSHHDLCDPNAGRLGFPRISASYHTLPTQVVGVLVESLVDAYRVNDYAMLTGAAVTAVALLGADLSGRDALRLANLFGYVMVCLDLDQWPKGAMRVVGRFAGMPVQVRATTLQTDPKDASDWSLEELFDRCREMSHA